MGTESARDQLERRNWSASSGTTRDSPLLGEPSSAAASSPPPGAIAVGASSVSNQDVLVPAVSAALERGDVRLLYVLGEEFDSYTAGAVWADTKMFAGHARGMGQGRGRLGCRLAGEQHQRLRVVDAREGASLRHR